MKNLKQKLSENVMARVGRKSHKQSFITSGWDVYFSLQSRVDKKINSQLLIHIQGEINEKS